MAVDISYLETEKRNPASMELHKGSTMEILKTINEADKKVAYAVEEKLGKIQEVVDVIVAAIEDGGRLIYMGAGTSGRVAVVDSVECPPTFGTDPEMVQALIAGGQNAFLNAAENIEDSEEAAIIDLKGLNFSAKDVLVAVAASGRTPYCVKGLEYAKEVGAKTAALVNNEGTVMGELADIEIAINTGREVLTGSTRMKSATAQKMVLNMISLSTMVKLGKVYQNLMVDVKANNEKLKERCRRIVVEATSVSKEEAHNYLEETDYNVKLVIVMIKANLDKAGAEELLKENNGHITRALEAVSSKQETAKHRSSRELADA